MNALIIDTENTTIIPQIDKINEFNYLLIDSESSFEELINQHSFDLILADVNLQSISIFYILDYLKLKNINIPVIIITDQIEESIITECIKNGASDFLLKSNINKLEEIISKYKEQKLTGYADSPKKTNTTAANLSLSSHIRFLRNLDRINQAIQRTNDLDQMMTNVLDEVLSIFDCDRAYLLIPCDPSTEYWSCPMERFREGYAGIGSLGINVKTTKEVAKTFEILLRSDYTVTFGSGNQYSLPQMVSEAYNIKSFMALAIHPKSSEPWQFGIHQCSKDRTWTDEEQRLFQEIGRRISDGLTSLLGFHKLKESDERFKRLSEGSRSIIFVKSFADSKYTYVSDSVFNILGYTPEELYNDSSIISKLIHKDSREYFEKHLSNLRKGIKPPFYEYKMVNRAGKEIWLYQKNVLIYNENNELISVEGIVTDITEQKNAEIKLRESEERLRYTIESANIGIWDWDLASDTWYASPSYYKILGYEPVSGNSDRTVWIKRVHPEDKEHVQKLIQNVLSGASDEYKYEARLLHADGSYRWQYTAGVRIIKNKEGKPVKIQGIRIDINDLKQVEEQLLQSEQKFRQLAEGSPNNIILYDKDCRITYANKIVQENKDFKMTHAYGTILENPEKDYQVQYLKKMKEVLATGKMNEIILNIPTFDGKIKVHIVRFAPYQNKNGDIIGVIAVGHDITEQKEAEAELKTSKERYKGIIDYAPIGIYRSKLNGEIPFCNEKLAKILGYESPEEITKLNIKNDLYFTPSKRVQIITLFDSGVDHSDFELRWKKKDGSPIWIVNSIRAIRDESGKIKYFDGFVRDIDSSKKTEIQLQKLYTAVEQSSIVIIITDYDGKIEYANPKFETLTGYKVSEVIGMNPRILNSGKHSKEFYADIWTTILSGKDWHGEILNKKKDGTLFWEETIISPIKDSFGKIINFVAVKEDVTEKKKIMHDLIEAKEKAEEMNRVKSTFFANMSHELRTPFVGIMGYAELLKENLTDPELQEMAVGLLNTSRRMKDTLTQILDITRLEFGETQFIPRVVDIPELFNNLTIQYSAVAKSKNLQLITKIKPKKLSCVTDGYIVNKILNNLLSNAVIYTYKGSVTISAEAADSKLIIKVSDTGIGIPKEKHEIIWQDFRQASEGKTRNFQGTGLGLSIVKKYVDYLDGEIKLESEVDKGSTFTVILPLFKNDITDKFQMIFPAQ